MAARIGPWAELGLAELRRPVLVLMAFCAAMAVVAGIAGAMLFGTRLNGGLYGRAAVIPVEAHRAFTAVAWAHSASYLSGFVGGLFLIGHTIWRRVRSGVEASELN